MATLFFAGSKLRASSLNPLAAVKTADETVNNSATLQNDDHLFFTVVANGIYRVECHVIWNSNSTADWSWAWSTPTGVSGYYTALTPAVGGTIPYVGAQPWSNPVGVSEGQGADAYTRFSGNLIVGSTGGTLQFKWAQNTATAVNTIVRSGSILSLTRVG